MLENNKRGEKNSKYFLFYIKTSTFSSAPGLPGHPWSSWTLSGPGSGSNVWHVDHPSSWPPWWAWAGRWWSASLPSASSSCGTSSFQLGLNRGIARPVQHCKFFLHLLQPVHDHLALVTRRAILEEEGGAVDPHEGQPVVFQDTFVALTIHGLVLGEEIETTLPYFATKTPPDHHTGAVIVGIVKRCL